MDVDATAPPSLTALTTYLLSLSGKAARQRMADRLAARGLRLWHMAVLASLDDFGPHAQRDLCLRLGLDPSDLAKAVDQFAGLGHVERTPDPDDRRRVRVAITAAGRRLLKDLQRDARRIDDEVFAALSAAERKTLHSLLTTLVVGREGAGARRAQAGVSST